MNYSLNQLYREIGISKQAVSQYFKRETTFDKKLAGLLIEVDVVRSECGGCGIEKMYDILQPDFIGRDRFVEFLMEYGYRIKHPKNFIRTTIPAHYRYPNLIEGSLVTDINQVWQSDITYFYVAGRFYYIVFIIDVYSRKIVGYQASDHMRAEANVLALKQAFEDRKEQDLSALIHHSDRGSQYIADRYTSMLSQKGISISMGLKATDNAFAERINGTIKNQYLEYKRINSLEGLRGALKQSVQHYNSVRPHNNLGKLSPIQFELEVLNIVDQKRPTVNIYTEGYPKIKEAFNLFNQSYLGLKEDLGAHICPMVHQEITN